MSKKIPTKSLGPASARFIQQLCDKGKVLFTLDNAKEIYGDTKQQTSHFLRDLVNRGILARIKNGVYLVLQMGQESTQLNNWPIIAQALVSGDEYYFSHYSAMRLHGMTTHSLKNVIVTMPKRKAQKKVHNLVYQFIYSKPDNFWGYSQNWVTKYERVWVSDLERTLLDGFDRPDLCGGIKEIIRGLWGKQNQISWIKLIDYATQFHSKATVKRLGYVLEILQLGIENIPSLKQIVADKNDYVLLDPIGDNKGSYFSRWKLRLNIDIDEIKASVWE